MTCLAKLIPGLAPASLPALALALGLAAAPAAAIAGAVPGYTIVDLGTVAGLASSQAFNISPDGDAIVGRSLGSSGVASIYTFGSGPQALPNLPGRNFAVANAVNNAGLAVGTSSTTAFGSNPLPVVWAGGAASALPLPAGQTAGRANDVNAAGVAVGSVNGGSLERPVIYSGGSASLITATTANGSSMRTAFGINDAGWVVGNGVDPANAALNVGLLYDIASGTLVNLGALPGANGALAFDVGNGGHVVGSSMLNQGASRPFIWTAGGGMVEIPLPAGTTQGSARGVNASGWAVGTASSAFAIPFVYDGSSTWRVADLLPAGSGWDLSTNTSSSALGISDDGIIVGTGVFNGQVRAYALVPSPVPEPATWALMAAGLALLAGLARRRAAQPGRGG